MCAQRRVCKFSDKKWKNVDLTQYSQIIIDTINNTNAPKEALNLTDIIVHKSNAIK